MKKARAKKEPKEVYRLRCPRCGDIKTWCRQEDPEGPGKCFCGAWASRVVMTEEEYIRRENAWSGVVVMSYKGSQRLHGPGFHEYDDKWVKENHLPLNDRERAIVMFLLDVLKVAPEKTKQLLTMASKHSTQGKVGFQTILKSLLDASRKGQMKAEMKRIQEMLF